MTSFAASVLPAAAAVLLLIAGLHDLAVRTVPNGLALALAGCGLGLALLCRDPAGIALSLAAMVAVFVAGALLWLRGLLGGADVKLLAAAALLVPADRVLLLLGTVAVAGGLLCIPYMPGRLLFRAVPPAGRAAGVVARAWRCERRRLSRRGPLPYAVAIAAGTLPLLFPPLFGG